jgi:asparagine synthase (glutamine-hydrolysing)
MWGFAVYDSMGQTLTLSRDPFGIKPLYLYDDGTTIAFSSEIRGLLSIPTISRAIDPRAVSDILELGYIVAPTTILAHARAVFPGETIVFDLSTKTQKSEVMKLDAPRRDAPSDDELAGVLRDSIKHHIIADVPVGLFFSGGIDSSILAQGLSSLGVPMTGYHISIGGKSDTAYAKAIADIFHIPMKERVVDPASVASLFESVFTRMDQPLADSSLLPTLLVSELAKGEVKVVLSGEGGDELFAGYARARRLAGLHGDITRLGSSSVLRRILQKGLETLPPSGPLFRYTQSTLRRFDAYANDPLGLYVGEVGLFGGVGADTEFRTRASQRLSLREMTDGPLALDRHFYLPDDLLLKIDTATMAHSIEGRVPFLDKEVFRIVGGAPLSWKEEAGVSKAPLRRLLKKNVPAEIIDRPKQGFSLPVSHYLSHEGKGRVEEAMHWYLDTYGETHSLFAHTFRALVKEGTTSSLFSALSYSLYGLVVLHAFVRTHRLTV